MESRGQLPLTIALDASIKAARVSLAGFYKVGGGLTAAMVKGDVGAVNAAMSAARAVFEEMGAEAMTHVIARPDSAVWAMLAKDGLKIDDEPEPGGAPPALRPKAEVPAKHKAGGPPAERRAAEAPAERAATEVPAERAAAEVPVRRKAAEAPALSGEGSEPEGVALLKAARKAGAKPKKSTGKKPRKPAK